MAHTYDTLNPGDQYSCTHFISSDDVLTFARVTGDDNPIHVDDEYAKTTRFGQRIVHGVLLLGAISKVLARDFPGPGCVAVALSAKFLRPVPVDSEIDVTIRITDKIESRKHIKAKVFLHLNGKMVLGGDATMLPPPDEP